MTDTQLLQEVLKSVQGLETRFDGLETRFDGLETRFDGLETRFDGLETRFDGLETRFDGLETRFDGLDKKVDKISTDLTDFREHMEGSINSLGKLSNQAFAHINEIRAEVVSPWKINNSK